MPEVEDFSGDNLKSLSLEKLLKLRDVAKQNVINSTKQLKEDRERYDLIISLMVDDLEKALK